jgi:hypothetical protein
MDTTDALQSPLYWVRPSALNRSFELYTGGQQRIGSLRFEIPWALRLVASLRTGPGGSKKRLAS